MEFECRITRSCIYWDKDDRDKTDLMINSEALVEAIKKLEEEAWRLEIRSGASKLVQEVLIKIGDKWVPISELKEKKEDG